MIVFLQSEIHTIVIAAFLLFQAFTRGETLSVLPVARLVFHTSKGTEISWPVQTLPLTIERRSHFSIKEWSVVRKRA
jgi:hypothetical protein